MTPRGTLAPDTLAAEPRRPRAQVRQSSLVGAAVDVGLMAELFHPAGSAAVADLPARERLHAFGLLFWAANLGVTVSAMAAGVLVRPGYGILFRIGAAASVLAALIVWRHIPETRRPTPKAARRALLPVLLRDPVMLAMAAIHVVYFATFLQAFCTLPLVMAADGYGPETYGAVLALNGIVIVVVQPIAVRLLGGRDRASVLAVSMLLVGGGGGLGAVAHGTASHAGSILVWTFGEIGIAVVSGATFADLRGRYMGVASTVYAKLDHTPATYTVLMFHVGDIEVAASELAKRVVFDRQLSGYPPQQCRRPVPRRPERLCRARTPPRGQSFRALRPDPGVPAAPESVPRRHRQQPVDQRPPPFPLIPAYSISKAAAFSLTQPLRALLAGRGGRSRRPSRAGGHRHDPQPWSTQGLPQSVARAIFDAVENNEEDIFPDPTSPARGRSWCNSPVQALERQMVALAQALVTAQPT
jgi:hypothetical protein